MSERPNVVAYGSGPARAGESAARALLDSFGYKPGGTAQPEDDALLCGAAAWAIVHFRPAKGFERALLETLGLQWSQTKGGHLCLARRTTHFD